MIFSDVTLASLDDKIVSAGMQEFKDRRSKLQQLIAEQFPKNRGKIIFFAPFEGVRNKFVQDSYFYYVTGLNEPALSLVIDISGESILYGPQYGVDREQWMASSAILNNQTMAMYGFDRFEYLGEKTDSYQVHHYFKESDYSSIIELLKNMIQKKESIFTIYPESGRDVARVKMIIDYLTNFVPELKNNIIDISLLLNNMRRNKSIIEIESIYRAVEITAMAFQSASYMTKAGNNESEIQAAIEYVYTENNAISAYYPIVAGGNNATVLHYNNNDQPCKAGDLILIDTGAMVQHYCADITRVFPVAQFFSDEQKELYNIVLDTQQHVVNHIRPGVWLFNIQEQEASLHHIALAFLKKHGYEKYMNHGIGHFLGLDVHDVGDRAIPLKQGDVITIEPGIYIPEKNIGIRIEDNYWVMNDAEAVCLSEQIPKSIEDIENLMQQDF